MTIIHIPAEDSLRVIFDDAAIGDLILAAEINGAVDMHTGAVQAGDLLAEMRAAQVLLALLGRLTRPARALILQNRDRSTPAMIAQMTQIASGPDYYRVAPTKEFASGTPIVFGNDNILPASAAVGRKDKAVSADGQRFQVRYVVVEAADVLTSNKADGTAIAAYEGGAHGKLRAIAGNGRLAGLIASFERGTAAEYVRELAEDDSHGVAAAAIGKFAQPVLVRVMNQEDVTENIGDISNQRGTSDLSPVEQAQNDSKRLDLGALDISDDGTPSEAAALAFIAAMPEAERNNLMDGKRPGQKAYDRLMAAVFWKAYNDAELVRLYAQSVDPEVKTILGGMASASGDLAKLDGAGDLDIRGLISAAAALAVNAKRQGVKLSLFAQQADMTLDPDTMDVVRMFADNIRSAKKIGERLRAAARFAYEEFTKEDSDMFGTVEKASRAQVLQQLEKPVEAPESFLFDAVGNAPASWLGFKIINKAATENMGASILPSDKSLAGPVWCALTDADGDPVYVAGIVVSVTFVASAVKYSVAFPIAPQPQEGTTLYAVVENIESGLVIDALPDDSILFDAVLTEDAAKMMSAAMSGGAVFDSIDPLLELELSGNLLGRIAALDEAGQDDPMATLTISGEIIAIIKQLEAADVPDISPAVSELTRSLEVLQNNEPINRASGNVEQADLEAATAESLKAAINVLAAAPGVEQHATESEGRAALSKIKPFLSKGQYSTIAHLMNGEEAEFYFDKMVEMAGIIATMPKTYETRDLGNKGIVSLHYFRGNSDWYITERDVAGKGTEQAFGFAILNGDRQNAELGYISIDELTQHSVELDLYWDKRPLAMVKNAMGDVPATSEPEHQDAPKSIEVDPTTPQGYAALTVADESRLQDDLDAFFQERLVAVRNAMRALGWDGLNRGELSKDGVPAIFSFRQVGAGANIVGMSINGISDDLTRSPAELAAAVDAAETAAVTALITSTTPEKQPVNMENYIKIAAETIGKLRRIDVYRVLNALAADNIDGVTRLDLATYIATSRDDLVPEVTAVMAEEWPDLAWGMPESAPLPAPSNGRNEVPAVPPVDAPQDASAVARAADLAFLGSVVSKSVDMWDDDLAEKIEKLGEAYAGDAEVEKLWGEAIASYTAFMVEAMSKQ